jgi:hypothetical protein
MESLRILLRSEVPRKIDSSVRKEFQNALLLSEMVLIPRKAKYQSGLFLACKV